MPQASPKKKPAAPKASKPAAKKPATKAGSRRIQVRTSGVHGRGMYAVVDIPAGESLIEYIGERITYEQAQDRHPADPAQPNHTFYFSLEDGNIIDANFGGNSSRFINHSCDPNCEADEENGRVFIKSLRDLVAGEELFYDYGLTVDERYTKKLKAEYACYCGAATCRGTMLTPKR
ncbi:SET domain-containing protein [Burkholderiaceae bacterium UC74_6]